MRALFLFFALIYSGLSAQTLQFSQVKVVTNSETVPGGKVWKVTSVFASSDLGTTGTTSTTLLSKRVLINGQDVFVSGRSYRFQGATSSTTSATRTSDQSYGLYTELPIWLPAGSTLASSTNSNGVSVIEFTVAP